MGEWETHCEALYRSNLRLNKSRLFLIPLKKSYNLVSQGNLYVLICECKVMVWYFQPLGYYVTKVRAVLVHYIFSVWWTLFLSLHAGSQGAARMSTLGISKRHFSVCFWHTVTNQMVIFAKVFTSESEAARLRVKSPILRPVSFWIARGVYVLFTHEGRVWDKQVC